MKKEKQLTSEEWQRIINEHIKGGCCFPVTIRRLRSGRFPPFAHVSTTEISDYLKTPKGEAYFLAREAAYEEQIRADVKAMLDKEEETLHKMSVYELWEELAKTQMRRGIAGDQEATRFAIQLLRVGPRIQKPAPEGPREFEDRQQKMRERWARNHKDDYDPPFKVPPLPPVARASPPVPPPPPASAPSPILPKLRDAQFGAMCNGAPDPAVPPASSPAAPVSGAGSPACVTGQIQSGAEAPPSKGAEGPHLIEVAPGCFMPPREYWPKTELQPEAQQPAGAGGDAGATVTPLPPPPPPPKPQGPGPCPPAFRDQGLVHGVFYITTGGYGFRAGIDPWPTKANSPQRRYGKPKKPFQPNYDWKGLY
ncbi:MAG: hypothetical protein ABSE73_22905 [Planctomycetota bacterium]